MEHVHEQSLIEGKLLETLPASMGILGTNLITINNQSKLITIVTKSKSFIDKYLLKYFLNLVSEEDEGGSFESNPCHFQLTH